MSADRKSFLKGRMQGMAHNQRRNALLGAMVRVPPRRPARRLRRGADMAGLVAATRVFSLDAAQRQLDEVMQRELRFCFPA